MKTFNLFIPLTKVDESRREVSGIATAELPDKSGEVFDYDSSLPYYKEWSGEIQKASGGKSLGNVREMHTHIAAGKLTQIEFNDAQKQIEICAKIVNDSTWEKVMEGVLTGFSHGGEYIKTWKDPENKKVTRYTARPSEISVVDNPCLGAATFQLVRADGATEMRKFKTKETLMTDTVDNATPNPATVQTVDGKPAQPKYKPVQKWEASDGKTFEKKEEWRKHELEIEATQAINAAAGPALSALAELEKAVSEKETPEPGSPQDPMTLGKKDFSDEERKKLADSGAALPDGSFPISDSQDLKNAIHAFGRAADKEKAKAHIIARAKALGEEKMLPEGWGGEEKKDDNGAEKAVMPTMKKGMQEVARTACMIQEMNRLADCLTWEAANEGDNSPQPNRFKQIITEMCSFLEALVEEECRELATPHAVELMGAETMAMAAGLDDELRKNLLGRMLKASGGNANTLLKLNSIFNQPLTKAGARHSAADKGQLTKAMSSLDEASDNLDDAKKAHSVVGKAHDGMRKCMGAMHDCMKSVKSGDLSKLDAEALEKYRKEADENNGKMADHMDEMETHLDKADKHQGKMAKAHDGIEAAHDAAHHALKAVGAMEPDDEAEKAAQATLHKAADELTLVKTDLAAKDTDLTATKAENAELKKALDTINGQVPALIERIKKLEAQPMPPKGAVFPVVKGHEAAQPAKPVEAPSYSTYGASPAEMREMMNLNL